MHQHIVVAALLAAVVSPVESQTVIQTPTSTIELIGLKRWTVKMVEDSLAVYSPKDTLTAHACAAILRGKLHFADAAVSVYSGFDQANPKKKYTAITLVEPQDSAQIHYKPAFRDSLATRAEWTSAYTAFTKNNGLAQTAIQTPSFYAAHLSPEDSAQFAKVEPLHALIASPRDTRQFEQAIRTLDTDGNAANRAMALLVISTYADRDSAWWALADALRDPSSGMINATASELLSVMARRAARPVDWRPIVGHLRYIIDGTDLFALNQLMITLAQTAIDPALAPALLAGGGTIVAAKLNSGDAAAKAATTAFLAQLSGMAPTTDAATLERWMHSVGTTARR